MIYIYKYENKINGNVYIGQTVAPKARHSSHMSAAFNKNATDYNSQFHQAVRKYGRDKFEYEILEIGPLENASEMERFWIAKYDSFRKGYNATPGGEFGVSQKGERNGRAKLNENDVIDIRNMYNDHVPFREAYALFSHKISKRGFQSVWWGYTWKHIMPEVYTDQNKNFHRTASKKMSSYEVHNAIFTPDEVQEIRKARDSGWSISEYYQKNNLSEKCCFGTLESIWYNKTYL